VSVTTNGLIHQFVAAIAVAALGFVLNLITGGQLLAIITSLSAHLPVFVRPLVSLLAVPLIAAAQNYIKHLLDGFTTPASP